MKLFFGTPSELLKMNETIAHGELQQAQEPTQAEQLAEAQAWGFDSADAFFDGMAEAYDEMALQENLNAKTEWD